jgi:ABC-type sugar transport system permease subunit
MTQSVATTRPVAGRVRLSEAEHRRLRRRRDVRRNLTGWACIAPVGVFFVAFLLVPVLGVFLWSTRNGGLSGASEFVGLANYQKAVNSLEASTAISNTVAFTLMSVPLIILIALGLALLMSRVHRGATVYRFLIYFPVLVPGVVVGLIWIFLTHADFGMFNVLLRSVGMHSVNWLSQATALVMVAAADIWRNVGYWTIFFLAAIIGLPREQYEAAHLDGAGAFQRFRYVTLPGIRRIVILAVLMATIWALQVFDIVLILTRGGPATATQTAVYFVWYYGFGLGKVGMAAAISVLLLVVILALTLALLRFMQERRAR